MSKNGEITITATEGIVVDMARWYKRPKRVFGKHSNSQYMRSGDTVTFQNSQQLLRALSGQLSSKETFGTIMEIG